MRELKQYLKYRLAKRKVKKWESRDPSNGGCWFCHDKDAHPNDSKFFCMEWDTNYHLACLIDATRKRPDNPEIEFFWMEWGLKQPENIRQS